MSTLNHSGQQLTNALSHTQALADDRTRRHARQEKVHVTGAGRSITVAYEQLRNAAEYTEEDLLLQRAARRFYRRLFMTRDEERIASSGEELIGELTLAGYILNDTIPVSVAHDMSRQATAYYQAYQKANKTAATQPRADEWTISLLSVEVATTLTDHGKRIAFAQFAYEHFLATIDGKQLFKGKVPSGYEAALLVAVYKTLLKADNAMIRHALLRRYRLSPDAYEHFIQINKQIDDLIDNDTVDKLVRVVNRRGAPLRVLWRMIDTHDDLPKLLQSPNQFLSQYEAQIDTEYAQMNTRINKGIVKSVIFLIITKFIVGISTEVPYDYMVHGGILWLPLAINLLFPPIYMVLLRLTLVLPGPVNTRALTDRIETILYGPPQDAIPTPAKVGGQYRDVFNSVYVLLMITVFGLVAWLLWSFGFSLLHLVIFFTFLSTASFLGFRLSRMIREIEAVDAQQSGITLVRDFLYLPFVVVGRWISENYARVNVVALILDMVIELPLKTVLRLVQQWGNFISSKKDEL
jgi:hypothetical protein